MDRKAMDEILTGEWYVLPWFCTIAEAFLPKSDSLQPPFSSGPLASTFLSQLFGHVCFHVSSQIPL